MRRVKRALPSLSHVVLAALLACARAAAQAEPDADALFARGVRLHQAGDIVGAVEAYQAALEKDPGRVDARSNLGAAFARLGRYDEAIEHYRAVLARAPDQVPVRFNLALALYKAGRTAEAAGELERVIADEPGHRQAALLLADTQLQLGNPAAVVAVLEPREKELGDDRLFAYLMGHALIQRNELLRGQAYIDRLFKGGETAQGHLLIGVAHLRRGAHREAADELERAATLNPDLPSVHSLLGRALLGMGRRDDAIASFRRELARNPNDFDASVYLGLLIKDDGRLDEAHEHLKRAARLRSQDPAVLYALGSLHLAAGRVEEAREALDSAVARVPDYTQAHVLLATAYYRLKDKERGDRHRAIADKLRAEQQAREPGAADELGPAYRGQDVTPPSPPLTPKEKRP